jgi:predicted HicB family RNase H-like nuclease
MGKKKMKESDKYLKLVEWSEEDECYIGTSPGLISGGVHGDDEVKVYKELCQVIEEAIVLYQEDKKTLPDQTVKTTYSGNIRLRMPPELHKKLAIKALKAKESLNSIILNKLNAI